MPRHARVAPGGYVYHALNRAVARLPLFQTSADYAAFEEVLDLAMKHHPTRILAYSVMPNHWHLVLWPRKDDELTAFVRWLTHTHTMRWHNYHGTVGTGHLYQGRFKSFPVETDEHLLRLCRYVERNPLRAGLVSRGEQWRWGSLWHRVRGTDTGMCRLHMPPIDFPKNWLQTVNTPQSPAEEEALRRSMVKGQPYGSPAWRIRTAARLGLDSTLRGRGRPRKKGTQLILGA